MAKSKMGFEYYTVCSNRYSDRNYRKLKKNLGCVGISVYEYIISQSFLIEGCFFTWDKETMFDVAEYWGIKENLLKEVINYCCSVDLFDKNVLANESVLTSQEMQIRFVDMCIRAKRNDIYIPENINLLPDETKDKIKIYLDRCKKNEKNFINKNSFSFDKNTFSKHSSGKNGKIPEKTEKFRNNGDVSNSKYIKETLSKERAKKGEFYDSLPEESFSENLSNGLDNNPIDELQTKPVNDLPKVLPSDFSNVFEKSLSECYEELSSNISWLEAILMSKHSAGFKNLDEDSLKAYLKKFFNRLTLQGITSKSPKDAMSHFVNWLDLELPKAKTDIHKEENEALMESVKEENAKYYKFLAYIQNQAPICFANMKLPSESESIFIREKYGSEMFKKALRTIEGRPDIRSKWDVLYFALLKQFDFIRLNS